MELFDVQRSLRDEKPIPEQVNYIAVKVSSSMGRNHRVLIGQDVYVAIELLGVLVLVVDEHLRPRAADAKHLRVEILQVLINSVEAGVRTVFKLRGHYWYEYLQITELI